jgi:hypothetical protein
VREQQDPVQLFVQASGIAFLLATVALSLGSLRDISACPEVGEASRTSTPTTLSQQSARVDFKRRSGLPSQKE